MLQQVGRRNAKQGLEGGDVHDDGKVAGAGIPATNRGFIAGRSTSDCLVALRMAMDTVLASGAEATIAFLDAAGAFDAISHVVPFGFGAGGAYRDAAG